MLKLRHEAGDGADHFKVYIGQVRIGGPGRNDSRARTQPKLDTDRRNAHIWGWFPVVWEADLGVPEFPAVGVPLFPGAPLKSKLTEAKARQATRIRELGSALTASGLVTLGEQARALGLSRSSAWAVLKATTRHRALPPARSIKYCPRRHCPRARV